MMVVQKRLESGASLVAARGSAGGSAFAAVSPSPAPAVVAPHALAARPQPASATGCGSSARSRRTRSPVLISTGQAVTHIPSTAQVCFPAYS